ncbi:MAG: hypothetical protein HY974_04290 [Candidatus Kerfeldbacteria bacterium]|nr:hypothetical protein [Candidatus Kerfeldbacteria bacterium]
MSFQSWLKQERLLSSGKVPFFSWFVSRRPRAWLEPAVLTALALVPFGAVWWQPFLLSYAILILGLAVSLTAWWTWERGASFLGWLAWLFMLTLYWSSSFLFWLFLETTLVRIFLLVAVVAVAWWYLVDWRQHRYALSVSQRGGGQLSSVAVGFISALALGSAAQGLIVFLDAPLWLLLLGCYLPLVLSFISLVYINGWSVRQAWIYYLTSAAVLLQVFIVSTWWPTSLYAVGFVMATVYAALGLALRQEAQGFINRRSFSRELLILAVALSVVLATAPWY